MDPDGRHIDRHGVDHSNIPVVSATPILSAGDSNTPVVVPVSRTNLQDSHFQDPGGRARSPSPQSPQAPARRLSNPKSKPAERNKEKPAATTAKHGLRQEYTHILPEVKRRPSLRSGMQNAIAVPTTDSVLRVPEEPTGGKVWTATMIRYKTEGVNDDNSPTEQPEYDSENPPSGSEPAAPKPMIQCKTPGINDVIPPQQPEFDSENPKPDRSEMHIEEQGNDEYFRVRKKHCIRIAFALIVLLGLGIGIAVALLVPADSTSPRDATRDPSSLPTSPATEPHSGSSSTITPSAGSATTKPSPSLTTGNPTERPTTTTQTGAPSSSPTRTPTSTSPQIESSAPSSSPTSPATEPLSVTPTAAITPSAAPATMKPSPPLTTGSPTKSEYEETQCTPTGDEVCPVARCERLPDGCDFIFDHYVTNYAGVCCPSLCYAVDSNGNQCSWDDKQGEERPTSSPQASVSSSSPTSISTPGPIFPAPTPSPTTVRLSFLPEYTQQAIVQDTESAQARALNWVEQHPEFQTIPLWRKKQLIALATLYYATGGDTTWDPEYTGWLDSSANECDWIGDEDFLPECTSDGKYQTLNLEDDNLRGTIPPEVSFLKALTYVDLSDNSLGGRLPSQLGQLSALTYLDFHENAISGAVPSELGQLPVLETLALAYNQLTGTIPISLAQLTNLARLYLWRNQLSGVIPTEIGQLTALRNLQLQINALTGPIPSELGLLTDLTSLSCFENMLTAPIPTEMGQLTALTWLKLRDNELSGPIPSSLAGLRTLELFHLYNNELSGTIPSELGQLTALTEISLRDNKLAGPIPSSLAHLTALESLLLWGNNLHSIVPSELGQLTALTMLSLAGNQLTGTVPSSLGQLTGLLELYLHDNYLSGEVPSGICRLTKLTSLSVDCDLVNCTCSFCTCK